MLALAPPTDHPHFPGVNWGCTLKKAQHSAAFFSGLAPFGVQLQVLHRRRSRLDLLSKEQRQLPSCLPTSPPVTTPARHLPGPLAWHVMRPNKSLKMDMARDEKEMAPHCAQVHSMLNSNVTRISCCISIFHHISTWLSKMKFHWSPVRSPKDPKRVNQHQEQQQIITKSLLRGMYLGTPS